MYGPLDILVVLEPGAICVGAQRLSGSLICDVSASDSVAADANRVGPRSQQNGEDKRAAKLRHPRSNVLEVAELNEVWRQAGNGAAQRQANQAEYGQEESRAIVSQPTERHS